MRYFAYGSNLCSRWLRERTPSAVVVAVAQLNTHVLRFHKVGFRDGSGKVDAFATGTATDVIWGAVYEIATAERPRLDHAEGLGSGYVDKMVEVQSTSGLNLVTAYVASSDAISPNIKPYTWYTDFVLDGAIEHDLPLEYVGAIRAVVSVQDPNEARAAEQGKILTSTKRVDLQPSVGEERKRDRMNRHALALMLFVMMWSHVPEADGRWP